MRRSKTAGACLLLALLALSSGGAGAAAGGRFAPAGEGFSVSFPGRPQKQAGKKKVEGFVVNSSSYLLVDRYMIYFVTWAGDLPAAADWGPLDEEVFFLSTAEGFVVTRKQQGLSARSMYQSQLSLGGFNGRQFVFSYVDDVSVLRVYRAGLRLYTVGVVGHKKFYDAEAAVAFLESFSLTGKK